MKIKRVLISIVIVAFIGFSLPYINYAIDSTYQKIKVFVEAFELIKENYVESKTDEDLIYAAISGMISSLDDFSQFLKPSAYERVKDDTEGEFGGIGIRIGRKDGWPVVVTPLPNTPAFKANIYPGDRIIKIEGVSTENMSDDEVVDKLRGKPGTKVKITLAREPKKADEEWQIFDLELVRAIIRVDALVYKMLNNETGLIRILEFSGHAYEDFKKAVDDMLKKGMKNLIIDLRYNPGGLLSASIDIAKLFIGGRSLIVYTKGRTNDDYYEYRAGKDAAYPSIPIVILVNKYSASASEILAGALKDNKRAVIVGENTFGKASVQTLLQLSDGSALRLTVAKYYTPSGAMIQRDPKTGKGGIDPDIEIRLSREEELKIYEKMQEIYYPDRDGKIKKDKEEEKFKDPVIDKALEVLNMMYVVKKLSS
ncbi:MAG: S41 family peptidase [Elusimicrobiales bacterium]|nr:S41 family peptidase [Elusimicrobiales bacterium]